MGSIVGAMKKDNPKQKFWVSEGNKTFNLSVPASKGDPTNFTCQMKETKGFVESVKGYFEKPAHIISTSLAGKGPTETSSSISLKEIALQMQHYIRKDYKSKRQQKQTLPNSYLFHVYANHLSHDHILKTLIKGCAYFGSTVVCVGALKSSIPEILVSQNPIEITLYTMIALGILKGMFDGVERVSDIVGDAPYCFKVFVEEKKD